MRGIILGLLAESYVHPGSGQAEGAIDLPVARERTTDYPFVPGSGVKGALRDNAFQKAWATVVTSNSTATELLNNALTALGLGGDRASEPQGIRAIREWAASQLSERNRAPENEQADQRHARERRLVAAIACEACYGRSDNAGDLVVSDAKLLLLPVRSLTGAYKWLTCPYLIERYQRDRARTFAISDTIDIQGLQNALDGQQALVHAGNGMLFLEERAFQEKADPQAVSTLATALGDLIGCADARNRLTSQLAIMKDDDFAWFSRFGLPVQAHNKLGPAKTSEALWYEETLAPDTLLYTMAFERKEGVLRHFSSLFGGTNSRPYLQLGGNETIGQGWFRIATVGGGL